MSCRCIKKFTLLLFLVRFVAAQFHEIGIFWGSNYIGDIGSHRYIDPNELLTEFIQMDVTDRYSLKGSNFFKFK